ncbi:MAG TPA: helix-turn-helix domain-containing protein [Actinomycetota bacterium]|nr:helix-turn-helix domain-containing protein [Actinomycetota bacterium]
MTRRWRRITPQKRREIIRLARRGDTYRQIADELDISDTSVGLVLSPGRYQPQRDVGSGHEAAVA